MTITNVNIHNIFTDGKSCINIIAALLLVPVGRIKMLAVFECGLSPYFFSIAKKNSFNVCIYFAIIKPL